MTGNPAPGLAPSNYQPYGESYLAASSSNTQRLLRGSYRSGLRMSGVAFEDASLGLPPNLGKDEERQLRERIEQELKRQDENPPILPESKVPSLPPKPALRDFFDVNSATTQEEVERLREENNKLTEEQALEDRQRNNMAAKKSRETRIEALRNSRAMLHETSAEKDWLRMKLITQRGDPDEWLSLPTETRVKLVNEVEKRVLAHEQAVATEKKNKEADTRAQRTRDRQLKAQEKEKNQQRQQQQQHDQGQRQQHRQHQQQRQERSSAPALAPETSPMAQPDFLASPPVVPMSETSPPESHFSGMMMQGPSMGIHPQLQASPHLHHHQQQSDPYGNMLTIQHPFASLDAMIVAGQQYDEYGRTSIGADMAMLYGADHGQTHQQHQQGQQGPQGHEHDQSQWDQGL